MICAILLPASLPAQQWSSGTSGTIYYNGGNVGIGTATPSQRLEVNGNVVISGWSTVVNGIRSNSGDYRTNATDLTFYTTDVERLRILQNNGNVGIGTTSPQYKLAVNGTIGAKEIIVTSANWSDYVFKPGYALKPLREIAAYINEHHHLPDIPSEEEVREKGAPVGEMQAKLLAKIEELTLHMIQAEQDNRELRAKMARLEERLSRSGNRTN